MNNFREVKDDILKDWLEFREQTDLAFTNSEFCFRLFSSLYYSFSYRFYFILNFI